MKKSAVEWLAEKYNYIDWMRRRDEISPATADEWRFKFLNEAKEMEKKQIVNAWMDDRFPLDKDWVKRCAEQYYNETFNTKETCTCKSAQFTREVTEDFEPMCGRCGRPI